MGGRVRAASRATGDRRSPGGVVDFRVAPWSGHRGQVTSGRPQRSSAARGALGLKSSGCTAFPTAGAAREAGRGQIPRSPRTSRGPRATEQESGSSARPCQRRPRSRARLGAIGTTFRLMPPYHPRNPDGGRRPCGMIGRGACRPRRARHLSESGRHRPALVHGHAPCAAQRSDPARRPAVMRGVCGATHQSPALVAETWLAAF